MRSLTEMSLEELKGLADEIESIIEDKSTIVSRSKYKSGKEAREGAKKRFEEIAPKIKKYLFENLQKGDLIRCKNYNGVKSVTLVNEHYVFAMCGGINRKTGEFVPNGAGSQTSIENVTEVRVLGKFVKIKDLI